MFQSSVAITCIKLISSVEYLVAVGNTKGEVTIFQIQKELPNEFKTDEIAASLFTTKPIERYTIKEVDRAPITCVEWSKNGMKLFSGDANGVVMLTEFDFNDHISKTIEILNEKHEIVQMNFSKPWLLVSTIYRAIVCRRTNENQWTVSQIGRTDRKVMNNFGAVFTPRDVNDPEKVPNIICSRPGFRFWMADCDGNVSHTYLLKNSVYEARSVFEVPLLNPVHNKVVNIQETYFGQCHFYLKKFIVTYCESSIFIINLDELKVMATIKRLRKIQYLSINNNEIFILEGGHSIVRLATVSSIITTNGIEQLQLGTENGIPKIVQADECFELPPIECIELNVPLACQLNEHNLLKEDKLLLEHSRKLEVFEKINTLDYDDSILFNGGTKKKKKGILDGSFNGENGLDGIVEIGRPAEFIDKKNERPNNSDVNENAFSKQNETRSFGINVKSRLKEANTFIGSFNGHDTLNSIAKRGQNRLSKISDSIIDGRIETDPSVALEKSQKRMEFSYPSYPEIGVHMGMEETNNYDSNDETKLNTKCNYQEQKTTKNASAMSLERLKDFPALANIPKLWDIKIERYDDKNNGQSPANGCSEISPGDDGIIDNEWVLL